MFNYTGMCSKGNQNAQLNMCQPWISRENNFQACFTGFVWPGFSSEEATGVASVRSCQKLPPCPAEPIVGGSKMGVAGSCSDFISNKLN